MVKFRSTKVTRKENDGIYLKLTLDKEEIAYLIEQLQAVQNERGVHLSVSVTKKTNSNTGIPFDSAVAFIGEVKEAPGGAARQVNSSPAAASRSASSAQAAVAKLRQQR